MIEVNWDEVIASLEWLAAAIKDNAPDMENDAEIGIEYQLLASVYFTIHAIREYNPEPNKEN